MNTNYPLVSVTTSQVSGTRCPVCENGLVPTPSFDFSSTTVVVELCSDCTNTTGIVEVEIRKSRLLALGN